MATPLATLLHGVLHDADVRAEFAASPDAFLADHGWPGLDAADLREALMVLADGAPAATAGALVTGAEAIDADVEGSTTAGAGLLEALTAIGAVAPVEVEPDHDPADLDDVDDVDEIRHQDPDGPSDETEDTDAEDPDDQQRPDGSASPSDGLAERLDALDQMATDGAPTDVRSEHDALHDVDVDHGLGHGLDHDLDHDPFDEPSTVAPAQHERFAPDVDEPETARDPGDVGDGWDELI